MKVEYHFYGPDKGWEEIQANLYNNVLERMPYSVFHPVSGERIKERFNFEKKDPQMVRYALSESGEPLAYIQASLSGNQVWIGYPWAVEKCPSEVQEKLFSDMFTYVKEKNPDKELVMGYISKTWQPIIDFAKEHGFEISDSANFYGVELGAVPPPNKLSKPYSSRVATMEDIPILLEITEADPRLRTAFNTMEEFENYYKTRVIPTNTIVLIFVEGQLVAAGAPLQQFYKGIFFRFQALRPGFEEYWTALAYEIAQLCISLKWDYPLLFASFDKEAWKIIEPNLDKLSAKLVDTQILHKFP